MELGIKPVYVFDGKPPGLKSGELAAREQKKQQAEVELAAALESGDAEEIRKASHRSVRVTHQRPPRAPRPAPRPAPCPAPRPALCPAACCGPGMRVPARAQVSRGNSPSPRRRCGSPTR